MTAPQPLVIDLTEHWSVIKHFANETRLGGKSCVHADQKIRSERLWRDQLVGHSGEAALHLYTHGSIEGYIKNRTERGKSPWTGDGGTDMPGAKVDIKCSYLPPGKDPGGFTLFVRDREFHENTVYYMGMMTCIRSPFQVYVTLAGWIPGEEYLAMSEQYDFNGDLVAGVPVTKLYRVVPIRWSGVTYMDLPKTHLSKGVLV